VKKDYEQIVENDLKPASTKGFTNAHPCEQPLIFYYLLMPWNSGVKTLLTSLLY